MVVFCAEAAAKACRLFLFEVHGNSDGNDGQQHRDAHANQHCRTREINVPESIRVHSDPSMLRPWDGIRPCRVASLRRRQSSAQSQTDASTAFASSRIIYLSSSAAAA